MPQRTPRRLAAGNYIGLRRYSLTICTNGRRAVFTSVSLVDAVLWQFRQCAEQADVAILAYCFMPDHVHLLVEGLNDGADVGHFLTRAKQHSGYSFSRSEGAHLWQRYAWDRVLRSDEDTWTVIRYILANPVRAGLVASPLEYRFSGSCVYSREALLDSFDRAG